MSKKNGKQKIYELVDGDYKWVTKDCDGNIIPDEQKIKKLKVQKTTKQKLIIWFVLLFSVCIIALTTWYTCSITIFKKYKYVSIQTVDGWGHTYGSREYGDAYLLERWGKIYVKVSADSEVDVFFVKHIVNISIYK